MKIQLIKPLVNSSFIDNGSNTFKNIEAIYLKDVNINLIKDYGRITNNLLSPGYGRRSQKTRR